MTSPTGKSTIDFILNHRETESRVVEFMEDETRDETFHPDIDSALEMHIGTGDFSYQTKVIDGEKVHRIMRMKNNQWKLDFTIDDEEVRTLDHDELTTFLVHQIQMNQAIKRRIILFIVLALAVTIPVVIYSLLILGIQDTDYFEKFLIAGGLTVIFIPVACFMLSSTERSVDASVYAIRPNLTDVFRKQIELKEHPYEKESLEKRIERFRSSSIR